MSELYTDAICTPLGALCIALQLMAPARALDGRVVDPAGLPIRNASVIVSSPAVPAAQAATAIDGSFRLEGLPVDAIVLIVSAAGFADSVVTVRSDQSSVVVELSARGIAERVTVSANPEGLRVNTPASATVLDYEILAAAPAWTLDDQLRTIPGFSLFRRSSSRVANPTTQGVTLRGLAASGASRTLVLADGVPLNDPFGGWVYWDRLPAASIASKLREADRATSTALTPSAGQSESPPQIRNVRAWWPTAGPTRPRAYPPTRGTALATGRSSAPPRRSPPTAS